MTHEAVEFEGLVEAVIGDEATDHGVPEEDIGAGGGVEEDTGMEGVAGFEAGAQDDVEEVVVVVEAEAEEVGVEVLELIEGLASLKEAFFDLESLEGE